MSKVFGDQLSTLCARELPAARRDPARASAMIEELASSLALTIAVVAGGEAKTIDTLLEGATAYLYETAAVRAGEPVKCACPDDDCPIHGAQF